MPRRKRTGKVFLVSVEIKVVRRRVKRRSGKRNSANGLKRRERRKRRKRKKADFLGRSLAGGKNWTNLVLNQALQQDVRLLRI